MQKRGQITSFMILGIILVVIVVLLIVFSKFQISKLKTKPSEEIARQLQIQNVKEYVDSCVKETAIDGLYVIGLQGGYINLPNRVLEVENIKIAYGYYKGKNVLIEKIKIQDELSSYMKESLPLCTNFSRFNFDISRGNISARSFIKNNLVSVELFYPLDISKGNISYKLNEKYSQEIPIRLGKIYDMADKIIDSEVKTNQIDISYILTLYDPDVEITPSPINNNTIIFMITDEKSKVDDLDYMFVFANEF